LENNLNVYLKQRLFLNQSLQESLHENLKNNTTIFSIFLTLFFFLQENLHFILIKKTASWIKKNPLKKRGKTIEIKKGNPLND